MRLVHFSAEDEEEPFSWAAKEGTVSQHESAEGASGLQEEGGCEEEDEALRER